MMWPPQSVKTCDTPSCLSARATTRPACIAIRSPTRPARTVRPAARRRRKRGAGIRSAQISHRTRPRRYHQRSRNRSPRDRTGRRSRLRSELDVLDVGDLLAEVLGEPLLHAGFDLPHALAADPEFVADLLERHGFLVVHERCQAPLVDDQVLALERLAELARRAADEAVVLLVRDGVGGLIAGRQEVEERRLLALGDRHVDGEVAPREALLHLDDLLLLDGEALGDELRLGDEPLALEPLALLLEAEEALPLRLRGHDLHHPPVVHDVADDVGAEPADRVRREADAAIRVEVLDRLEEPDVALLDEVEEVVERPLVLPRDHDDQPEVRGDEPPGGLSVLLLVPADGECVLLLA